jgi:hypothetical protein
LAICGSGKIARWWNGAGENRQVISGGVTPFGSVHPYYVSQTNQDDRNVDLSILLDRVARALESVVPGLHLAAEIGGPVWLEEEIDNPDGSV